jgi:hypothetical protein
MRHDRSNDRSVARVPRRLFDQCSLFPFREHIPAWFFLPDRIGNLRPGDRRRGRRLCVRVEYGMRSRRIGGEVLRIAGRIRAAASCAAAERNGGEALQIFGLASRKEFGYSVMPV